MKGELWEECPECGREPVCAACQLCENHCGCDTPVETTIPPPPIYDDESDMPHPARTETWDDDDFD